MSWSIFLVVVLFRTRITRLEGFLPNVPRSPATTSVHATAVLLLPSSHARGPCCSPLPPS